ncbi:jg5840 [Pararge aegeria aegeria]|uniref:Jg5840 protein n=1 Tax=Pararge aegeria aegeria TaxID=348720 RepID=A0A8S4SEQ9_9NEOP|nr:jg5840 [Pararge aegeria aegeria]
MSFELTLSQTRATLAEKEVTTLKEQLATTSPTPLQATVPLKTNGSHIEPTRDQATETRIPDRFSPDIKEEKRRSPDIDEDIEQKIEMAATARSNSNSSRSSPVVNQSSNLENELAAKEKEYQSGVRKLDTPMPQLIAIAKVRSLIMKKLGFSGGAKFIMKIFLLRNSVISPKLRYQRLPLLWLEEQKLA